MKVGMMGAGHVGLASALVFNELGHDVTLFDVDPARVATLCAGEVPFFEPGIATALQAAMQSGRWIVTEQTDALAACDAVLIAVPTPLGSDGQYDLDALRRAVDILLGIRARAASGVAWRGVFLRSTVLPGTTQRVLGAALPCPVGHLSEFLREGSVLADARRPDRIVVGTDDPDLRTLARALFAGLETTWVETGTGTAELTKLVNNALLATCVSFANEIARLAETLDGVDAVEVFEAVHLDRRFRGSPRAGIVDYLLPGPGFGGSCLPKDLAALAVFAGARPDRASILDAALQINRTQPTCLVERVDRALGGLAGRRVLVLGLAFKPGTDDLRESIAIPLARELAARGAVVRVHDPEADPTAARALLAPLDVTVVPDDAFRDAFDAADAVLLVTPWPRYLNELPELLARRATALLFVDTRGMFRTVKRAACVTYLGVGARDGAAG